jgi:hypothetical protein
MRAAPLGSFVVRASVEMAAVRGAVRMGSAVTRAGSVETHVSVMRTVRRATVMM